VPTIRQCLPDYPLAAIQALQMLLGAEDEPAINLNTQFFTDLIT
jgi:hypothetical protein